MLRRQSRVYRYFTFSACFIFTIFGFVLNRSEADFFCRLPQPLVVLGLSLFFFQGPKSVACLVLLDFEGVFCGSCFLWGTETPGGRQPLRAAAACFLQQLFPSGGRFRACPLAETDDAPQQAVEDLLFAGVLLPLLIFFDVILLVAIPE